MGKRVARQAIACSVRASPGVAEGTIAKVLEVQLSVSSLQARAEQVRAKAATVLFVGIDARPAGFVGIADPKETTPRALEALRREKLHVVMLAGDGKTTAEAVGRELVDCNG